PIAIVIGDGNAQRFRRLVEAQLVRDLGEVSVAIVVVNQHGYRWKMIRVAVASISLTMLAAPYVFPVPLDVAFHDKIEQSVIVQVYPGGGGVPGVAGSLRLRQPGLFGHIAKSTVAGSAVKPITAIRSDEYILKAVVVIIGYGHAHPQPDPFQPGFFRNVFKGAIGFLVKHPVPVSGTA